MIQNTPVSIGPVCAAPCAFRIPYDCDCIGYIVMIFCKCMDHRQPIEVWPGHSEIEVPVSGHCVVQAAQASTEKFIVYCMHDRVAQIWYALRIHIEKLTGMTNDKVMTQKKRGLIFDGYQQISHQIAFGVQRYSVGGN